jgi:hypothetical protein
MRCDIGRNGPLAAGCRVVHCIRPHRREKGLKSVVGRQSVVNRLCITLPKHVGGVKGKLLRKYIARVLRIHNFAFEKC